MRLRAEVAVAAPADRVFEEAVATVLPQAVDPVEPGPIERQTTILTRWRVTVFRFITAETTERVTIVPGDRVAFEHVGGPIVGTREVFRIEPRGPDTSAIRYRAVVRVGSRWWQKPLEWLVAGPLTYYASVRFARGIRDRAEERG